MADFTLPQVRKAEGLHPTGIEWTDYSANPLRAVTREGKPGWACVKVSSGCANCYSETINLRFGTGLPFVAKAMPDVRVVLDEQRVAAMLAAKPRGPFRAPDGRPKVFIGDMTDVFGSWVPFETLDRLFAIFALRPDIDWQVLTKRPERMAEYLNADRGPFKFEADHTTSRDWIDVAINELPNPPAEGEWPAWPLPNVWLGTSVEDQAAADARIPHLLRCPAAVRFLSVEPLLGPVDFSYEEWLSAIPAGEPCDHGAYRDGPCFGCLAGPSGRPGIDWVIVGGESGTQARPCNLDWIRGVVRQCADAAVPCFVKQIGSRPVETERARAPRFPAEGSRPFEYQSEPSLRDSKGGDPSEWSEELRVRQWPEARR